jgi:hypothetical protein
MIYCSMHIRAPIEKEPLCVCVSEVALLFFRMHFQNFSGMFVFI